MLEAYPRLPGESFLEYAHRLMQTAGSRQQLQKMLDMVDNFGEVPIAKTKITQQRAHAYLFFTKGVKNG